jgi:hypothetical protein
MLKKIVSIFLMFAFAIFLIGFIAPVANADSFPSPTVTENDMRLRYFPDIITDLYRICDNDGNLTRFVELKDVSYSLLEDFAGIDKNVKFAFNIETKSELADDEYMELIVIDKNDIEVYDNGVKVPVEKVGEYNIVHLREAGLITIK